MISTHVTWNIMDLFLWRKSVISYDKGTPKIEKTTEYNKTEFKATLVSTDKCWGGLLSLKLCIEDNPCFEWTCSFETLRITLKGVAWDVITVLEVWADFLSDDIVVLWKEALGSCTSCISIPIEENIPEWTTTIYWVELFGESAICSGWDNADWITQPNCGSCIADWYGLSWSAQLARNITQPLEIRYSIPDEICEWDDLILKARGVWWTAPYSFTVTSSWEAVFPLDDGEFFLSEVTSNQEVILDIIDANECAFHEKIIIPTRSPYVVLNDQSTCNPDRVWVDTTYVYRDNGNPCPDIQIDSLIHKPLEPLSISHTWCNTDSVGVHTYINTTSEWCDQLVELTYTYQDWCDPQAVPPIDNIVICENWKFYVPTAISPNSDWRNDVFKLYTWEDSPLNLEEYTVEIYNRRGALVAQLDWNDSWDGKFWWTQTSDILLVKITCETDDSIVYTWELNIIN